MEFKELLGQEILGITVENKVSCFKGIEILTKKGVFTIKTSGKLVLTDVHFVMPRMFGSLVEQVTTTEDETTISIEKTYILHIGSSKIEIETLEAK